MKKQIVILVWGSLLAFSACKKKKEEPVAPVSEMNDTAPAKSTDLKRGSFSSYAHSLAGDAVIVKDSTGNIILRLEKYTMTSGPDVDLVFSKTANYSSSSVIKIADLNSSYSNNSLNFDFDEKTIDHSVYKYVIVYCVQFTQQFGEAEPK